MRALGRVEMRETNSGWVRRRFLLQVRRRALAIALGGSALGATTHARADVVDDATSVIEQLVEDNIAHQVVPSVACKMPMAQKFFPGTVGAIESERFSGLPVILRKETSDLLGLAIVRQIDPTLVATCHRRPGCWSAGQANGNEAPANAQRGDDAREYREDEGRGGDVAACRRQRNPGHDAGNRGRRKKLHLLLQR